jgi:hypothetical protein
LKAQTQRKKELLEGTTTPGISPPGVVVLIASSHPSGVSHAICHEQGRP